MPRKKMDDAFLVALLAGLVIAAWLVLKGIAKILLYSYRRFNQPKLRTTQIASRPSWESLPMIPVPPGERYGLMMGEDAWRELCQPTMQWKVSDATLRIHLLHARESYLVRDDHDAARRSYQKVAYGKRNMTEEEQALLTAEIAAFAGQDRDYAWMLPLLKDSIAREPGVLQSELIEGLPDERDLVRYVLYYAHVRGELVRVKKGRSYRLYIPKDLPTDGVPLLAVRTQPKTSE